MTAAPSDPRWRRCLIAGLASALLGGCWFQPGWGAGRTGFSPVENRLTASNVATLTEAWSTDLGSNPVRDPVTTVHGVHAVSGFDLTTVRLDDGTVRWSVLVRAFVEGDTIGSPSIAGDAVLVPLMGIDPNASRNYTLAFDPTTGVAEQGTRPFGAVESITVEGSSTAAVTRVEFPDGNGFTFLYLLGAGQDPSWGLVLEQLGPTTPTPTTPSLGADRLLMGRGSRVEGFARPWPDGCDVGRCRARWSRDLGQTVSAPIIDDPTDTAYVGDSSGGVWALNTVDGGIRWRADLGGTRGVVATPSLGYGHLFVPSTDGRLYAFDADGCGASTCPPVWEAAVGGRIDAQAALGGGVVYVGSDDGTVAAFDATGCGSAQCAPLWTDSVGSGITGAPILANGHLIVGTADGRLIAFRPEA